MGKSKTQDRPHLEIEEHFIAHQALKAIRDKLTEHLNEFDEEETRSLRLILCFHEPKKLDEIRLEDEPSVYDTLPAVINNLPAKHAVVIFISTVIHASSLLLCHLGLCPHAVTLYRLIYLSKVEGS